MKFPRLKDIREDRDMTQKDFAEKLGLYTTTYARYERGEQDIPLSLAVDIAKFYNLSLDYLAGLIASPEPLDRPKK